jgi:hypothetical protein
VGQQLQRPIRKIVVNLETNRPYPMGYPYTHFKPITGPSPSIAEERIYPLINPKTLMLLSKKKKKKDKKP